MDELEVTDKTHKIEIFQREQVRIQGVVHVDSFDDRQVVVETDMGIVTLAGEEFHITSLDLEKGHMIIEGMFEGLEYSALDKAKARQKDKGFLERLFR